MRKKRSPTQMRWGALLFFFSVAAAGEHFEPVAQCAEHRIHYGVAFILARAAVDDP